MMTLGHASRLIPHSRVEGAAATTFTAVSTDSRSAPSGCLFVALRGPRFDGHSHAAAALARGAVALLVEHPLDLDCPQLIAGDTRRALGQLAGGWRAGFHIPLAAVTGSNGKTTVTQMVSSILARAYGHRGGRPAWAATRGNLNNEIGLPLMLLELAPWHRAAVFELGMNHPGEIANLAALARPAVALVNNAQREHQEFLDGVEATARENGAVIEALAPDGVAVFPADDPCARIWRRAAGTRRVLDFGLREQAAVTAEYRSTPTGSALSIATPVGVIQTQLHVAGVHNVHNALAACACALGLGVGAAPIAAGLAAFAAVGGRGVQLRALDGAVLIDDTYNANPDSVRAAIDVLAQARSPRLLILGDMGEVGLNGPQFHHEIGAYAAARGIERLLAAGAAAAHAVPAFGAGGQHFETVEELLRVLGASLPEAIADPAAGPAAATILVKGSRFMRMERVVALLRADDVARASPEHS